jgi:hypothetical protein
MVPVADRKPAITGEGCKVSDDFELLFPSSAEGARTAIHVTPFSVVPIYSRRRQKSADHHAIEKRKVSQHNQDARGRCAGTEAWKKHTEPCKLVSIIQTTFSTGEIPFISTKIASTAAIPKSNSELDAVHRSHGNNPGKRSRRSLNDRINENVKFHGLRMRPRTQHRHR